MSSPLLHASLLAMVVATGAAAQSIDPSQQPRLPSRAIVEQRVDSLIRSRLAGPQAPASISVAIIRGRDTLVRHAWGTADVANDRPATTEATYRMGSVSKQFTAALLLRLVDRGALSLGDTLGHYMTDLRREWRGVSIEQLLNHTAGMQREYRQHVPPNRRAESIPGDTLLAWAARDTMIFTPGTQHAYSNTGYMMLGLLIERLYGKPYAEVVRDEIARPLGLATLGWCTAPEKRATETRPHRRSDGVLQVVPVDVNPDLAIGAGGLCSTAGDLAAWNFALHGGRVLSPRSYEAMMTPRGAAASERYGFGIRAASTPWGSDMLGHGGATPPGFLAESAWFPAESLAIAVLYNSGPQPGAQPMVADLARIALGK
jgi:D-alanyl-D-alanine carboxypeptidase